MSAKHGRCSRSAARWRRGRPWARRWTASSPLSATRRAWSAPGLESGRIRRRRRRLRTRATAGHPDLPSATGCCSGCLARSRPDGSWFSARASADVRPLSRTPTGCGSRRAASPWAPSGRRGPGLPGSPTRSRRGSLLPRRTRWARPSRSTGRRSSHVPPTWHARATRSSRPCCSPCRTTFAHPWRRSGQSRAASGPAARSPMPIARPARMRSSGRWSTSTAWSPTCSTSRGSRPEHSGPSGSCSTSTISSIGPWAARGRGSVSAGWRPTSRHPPSRWTRSSLTRPSPTCSTTPSSTRPMAPWCGSRRPISGRTASC